MSLFPFYPRNTDRLFGEAMREMQAINRMFDLDRHPYWSERRLRDTTNFGAGVGHVVDDANKYAVTVDVSHFKPEELQVNAIDNTLVIEGHHEETADGHGHIERHFVRKYALPDDVRADAIMSELSADGKLTVGAPKKNAIDTSARRSIPIQQQQQQAIQENPKIGGNTGGNQMPNQEQKKRDVQATG